MISPQDWSFQGTRRWSRINTHSMTWLGVARYNTWLHTTSREQRRSQEWRQAPLSMRAEQRRQRNTHHHGELFLGDFDPGTNDSLFGGGDGARGNLWPRSAGLATGCEALVGGAWTVTYPASLTALLQAGLRGAAQVATGDAPRAAEPQRYLSARRRSVRNAYRYAPRSYNQRRAPRPQTPAAARRHTHTHKQTRRRGRLVKA